MRTLFADKHDLLRDDPFKRLFLSAELRQRIAIALDQYARRPVSAVVEDNYAAAPSQFNSTIFHAWDLPTSYTISAGHQSGDQASYDVVYHWGHGTQYEGDQRITSVILTRENARWYVDDLYTHNGKFISASSLYESLVR